MSKHVYSASCRVALLSETCTCTRVEVHITLNSVCVCVCVCVIVIVTAFAEDKVMLSSCYTKMRIKKSKNACYNCYNSNENKILNQLACK